MTNESKSVYLNGKKINLYFDKKIGMQLSFGESENKLISQSNMVHKIFH